MSCFNSNCYLPQPPRAWSRVQNSCSLITDSDNNSLVRDPYTGQLVPPVVLAERIAMLNKGNILQYKSNSSNLTRAQKYSKIAKGQWVNRNTTWATQSTRGYTNPNTTSLKRSGNVVNIAIDPITGAVIGPTTAPQTCPQPVTPTNEGLPSNGGGGSSVIEPPPVPPPVPPTPGSETFPDIIADTPVEPIVIQDGGILICSIQEDPCTGETKSSLAQQLCHPTTDSDVPGPIQELCWNDGTQTWYPRSRYIMTNSANKWPVNAELFSSVIISNPVITSITSNKNIITLIWLLDGCLPATNFNIYQDGILIKTVPGNVFTTEVIVSNCNSYQYYIVAENITAKQISDKSNIVEINIAYIEPPTNLMYITLGSGTIELSWDTSPSYCGNLSYGIYQDFTQIATVLAPIQYYQVSGLDNCVPYTFSVSAIDINGESSLITLSDVVPLWPDPPIYFSGFYSSSTNITVFWGISSLLCVLPTEFRIWYSGDGTNYTSEIVPFNIDTLYYNYTLSATFNTGQQYYLYMEVISGSNVSTPSNTVTVTPSTTDLYTTFNSNYDTYLPSLYNYFIFYQLVGNIKFNYDLYNTPVYLAAIGGGGAGAWGPTSGGGAGGGQVLTSYTNIITDDQFDITQIGSGGTIVTNGNGNAGGTTKILDRDNVQLELTGGAGGSKTAATHATEGTYTGPTPSPDSTLSGGGGIGGRNSTNACGSPPTARGGDSLFYIKRVTIQSIIGFDLLTVLQNNFGIRIGGGGAGTASTAGEGGSQNGSGQGGFPSCSLNVTTQDAGGIGAGGGAYSGNYVNYVKRSGIGKSGGALFFFQKPPFYTKGAVSYQEITYNLITYSVLTFNYSASTQEIIFNPDVPNPILHINLIVIGGGSAGSGGYTGNGTYQYAGSGGSGGGVICLPNINPCPSSSKTIWSISVGKGGTCPANTDNAIGSDGGDSSFATIGKTYISQGASAASGFSYNAGNPGQGFEDGNLLANSLGGLGGNLSGSPPVGIQGSQAQTVSFTTAYNTTYYFSGGGGSGNLQDTTSGSDTDGYSGYAGTTTGGGGSTGSVSGIVNNNGENGTIRLGAGGGGGSLQIVSGNTTFYKGGDGGDGVVIVYFLKP